MRDDGARAAPHPQAPPSRPLASRTRVPTSVLAQTNRTEEPPSEGDADNQGAEPAEARDRGAPPGDVGARSGEQGGGSGPPVPFVASYEWQDVPEGTVLPPGLKFDMPLDGGKKRACIPESWQLRVHIEDERHGGFWRRDNVGRATTVGELRADAAKHLEASSFDRIDMRFADDAAPLDDAATAEQLGLFSRMQELRVLRLRGDAVGSASAGACTTNPAVLCTSLLPHPRLRQVASSRCLPWSCRSATPRCSLASSLAHSTRRPTR